MGRDIVRVGCGGRCVMMGGLSVVCPLKFYNLRMVKMVIYSKGSKRGRAYSTSNQLGVMTVASGNRSLYTGITSAATYRWPASPITATYHTRSNLDPRSGCRGEDVRSKRYINPSLVAFNFFASCATAVRASAPGI